jgi:hypothetical protein
MFLRQLRDAPTAERPIVFDWSRELCVEGEVD